MNSTIVLLLASITDSMINFPSELKTATAMVEVCTSIPTYLVAFIGGRSFLSEMRSAQKVQRRGAPPPSAPENPAIPMCDGHSLLQDYGAVKQGGRRELERRTGGESRAPAGCSSRPLTPLPPSAESSEATKRNEVQWSFVPSQMFSGFDFAAAQRLHQNSQSNRGARLYCVGSALFALSTFPQPRRTPKFGYSRLIIQPTQKRPRQPPGAWTWFHNST